MCLIVSWMLVNMISQNISWSHTFTCGLPDDEYDNTLFGGLRSLEISRGQNAKVLYALISHELCSLTMRPQFRSEVVKYFSLPFKAFFDCSLVKSLTHILKRWMKRKRFSILTAQAPLNGSLDCHQLWIANFFFLSVYIFGISP